jgi:hypothetical protein
MRKTRFVLSVFPFLSFLFFTEFNNRFSKVREHLHERNEVERELKNKSAQDDLKIVDLDHINQALRRELARVSEQLAQRHVLYASLCREARERNDSSQLMITDWERKFIAIQSKYEQVTADFDLSKSENHELRRRCQEYEREIRSLQQMNTQLQDAYQQQTVEYNNTMNHNRELETALDRFRNGFSAEQFQVDSHEQLTMIRNQSEIKERELREEIERLHFVLKEQNELRDRILNENMELIKKVKKQETFLFEIKQSGMLEHFAASRLATENRNSLSQPRQVETPNGKHNEEQEEQTNGENEEVKEVLDQEQEEAEEDVDEDAGSASWLLKPSDSNRQSPMETTTHRSAPIGKEHSPDVDQLFAFLTDCLRETLHWKDCWPLHSESEMNTFVHRLEEETDSHIFFQQIIGSPESTAAFHSFLEQLGIMMLYSCETTSQQCQEQLLKRRESEKSMFFLYFLLRNPFFIFYFRIQT